MRESKFELLRVVAMLMIVAGHTFSYLGDSTNLVDCLLGNGSRVGVNMFLMLGVWFMVDSQFSARRILKLYVQVLFWSIPLTAMMFLSGYDVPIKEIGRGFFPFWGRGLWFASAYMVLLFWAPFLRRVFRLPARAQGLLLVTLLLFTVCVCTLPDPQMSYALDLYWFACVYLFIGFVKYHLPQVQRMPASFCLIGGALVYTALATGRWYGNVHSGGIASAIGSVSYQWLVDFKTLPNLVASFLLFLGFLNLKLKPNVFINTCARNTFGVYIIHCIPSFHGYLFREWIAPLGMYLAVPVLFIGCSLLDEFRARFFAPLYEKSRFFTSIAKKIDGIYESCGMKD